MQDKILGTISKAYKCMFCDMMYRQDKLTRLITDSLVHTFNDLRYHNRHLGQTKCKFSSCPALKRVIQLIRF